MYNQEMLKTINILDYCSDISCTITLSYVFVTCKLVLEVL